MRWDPVDMTSVAGIRAFEGQQSDATRPVVGDVLQLLRLVQALLLNAGERSLPRAAVGNAKTPLFFLIHTVVDDLRQVESGLEFGYTVAVAWALRDALEATALASLFWRDRRRAEMYWRGVEFKPAAVRKELEQLGLAGSMVGSLWASYAVLSKVSHPNLERMLGIVDEKETPEGVVHELRAGGTRDEKKLRMFAALAAGCCFDVAKLMEPIFRSFLASDDARGLEACVRDVCRRAGSVLEEHLSTVPSEEVAMAEGGDPEYEKELWKSLGAALAKLKDSVGDGLQRD